jgi:transcriptional regulator with XRE-family HTH domain
MGKEQSMPVRWKLGRIRKLREQRSLDEARRITMHDVAKATGLSYATIQRWETGDVNDPDPALVNLVAEYFGVPLSYFFDNSIEENMPGNRRAPPVSEVSIPVS